MQIFLRSTRLHVSICALQLAGVSFQTLLDKLTREFMLHKVRSMSMVIFCVWLHAAVEVID